MNRPYHFKVRTCDDSDMDGIAEAHRDSIETLCSDYYSADLIEDWVQPITPDRYRDAISQGAAIHVAEGKKGEILGFSEVYRVRDTEFNTAVFVSGRASRRGIGTALYQCAESCAVAAGAGRIELNASLAAVAFYRAQGFKKCHDREIETTEGKRLQVVHMRKDFALKHSRE